MAVGAPTVTVIADGSTSDPVAGNHTPGSTPRSVLVLCFSNSPDDQISGVTYGGVAMAEVAGSPNLKTAPETMSVYAYHLGAGIPTGTQEVSVARSATNALSVVCITNPAAKDTEIVDSDASVNTGSATNVSATLSLGGRTSFCALAGATGENAPAGSCSPLSNWTSRAEHDFGVLGGLVYTYNTISTVDVTAGWTQSSDDAVMIAVAVSEVTEVTTEGALASTEGTDAAAASGQVVVTGAGAATEATDALAAAGQVVVAGALAATEPADAVSVDGTVADAAITGELAVTEATDALAGQGQVFVSGSLEATDGQDVLATAGSVFIAGGLAAVEVADVAAVSGAVVVAGDLAATDAPDALAAPGQVLVGGTADAVEAPDTFAAVGGNIALGALAAVEALDAVDASGTVPISGDMASTEPADGAAAGGQVIVSAAMAAIEASDIVVGEGYILVDGALAVVEGVDVFVSDGDSVAPAQVGYVIVATARQVTVRGVSRIGATLGARSAIPTRNARKL